MFSKGLNKRGWGETRTDDLIFKFFSNTRGNSRNLKREAPLIKADLGVVNLLLIGSCVKANLTAP